MSLRDTLASRGLPVSTFPLRAVPSEQVAAAQRELDAATAELQQAELRRAVTTAHRRRVEDAGAALRACFTTLTLRALPPQEMEELLAEHPPTDAQRAKDATAVWNGDTFPAALLARVVYDDPDAAEPALTAAEWAAELRKGSSSIGEAAALFSAAFAVNDRTPDGRLPFGSTPTRS